MDLTFTTKMPASHYNLRHRVFGSESSGSASGFHLNGVATTMSGVKPKDADPSITKPTLSETASDTTLEAYLEEHSKSNADKSCHSQWLKAVLNGEVNIHPAELSGASPNPKLQLLGIALEVRTMIFREILIDATNTAIGLTFRHYTPNGVRYKRKRNGTQQAYQTTCRVNARQDRQWSQMLSLLRVSRQTYEEGCPIFYGLNAWYKSSVQNFEYHPSSELPQPSDLPAKKMALIKDLSLKFDLLSTRANFATFDELIGFICSGFPRLQHLRLTFDSKQYTRAFWGQASSNGYVKEMGALLSVVATLTRQHPVLKKAIWSAESGVRHHYTNSYRDMPVLQLFSGGIAPHHSEYSFVVDLVTPRREDVLFNAGGGGLDDNGEASISKNIILDCQKIRNTPLQDRLDLRIQDFALPKSAISSEPQL